MDVVPDSLQEPIGIDTESVNMQPSPLPIELTKLWLLLFSFQPDKLAMSITINIVDLAALGDATFWRVLDSWS